MPVLGVTGGVATGKSTFCRALLRRWPVEHFDADRAVHELLAGDAVVRDAIIAEFGPDAYLPDGTADRRRLRELVFQNDVNRRRLEAILHPAVRRRWEAPAAAARLAKTWFVADIPLLYETGGEAHCDRVVVVACSRATQLRRLRQERGLNETLAAGIISAQLDLETKTKRADHLIWSDSTAGSLDAQVELLTSWLSRHYG